MLDQALKRFPAQIESVEVRIRRFKTSDDTDCVRIVIESAGVSQSGAQCILSGMAEGWMAEIVGKAEGFGEVLVEAKRTRDRSSDLRNFEAMRQPDAEMVTVRSDEDLGLVTEPPEGDAMDDAIAVALENVARTAWG